MAWLSLAALGFVWVAFLLPTRRRHSPDRTVEDFGRNMDLLADTGSNGRYIITPRKGMAFVGPRERAKERARERRRRVFLVMLELIGLTALIGLAPPLRVMWFATAFLLAALGIYVWMLVTMKAREDEAPVRSSAAPRPAARPSRPAPAAVFDGLEDDDLIDIVVRPARGSVSVAGV